MEFVKEEKRTPLVQSSTPVPDDKDLEDSDNNDDQAFNPKRIWIGNIERTIPEFVLLKLAQPFGDIDKFDFAYVKTGQDKGKPCGYCFVTYKETSSADGAIKKLNGYTLKDRQLTVKHANKPAAQQTQPQASTAANKSSQIAAIEAKLQNMNKEETTDIKQKLLSSAKPPPLMSLDVKPPSLLSLDIKRPPLIPVAAETPPSMLYEDQQPPHNFYATEEPREMGSKFYADLYDRQEEQPEMRNDTRQRREMSFDTRWPPELGHRARQPQKRLYDARQTREIIHDTQQRPRSLLEIQQPPRSLLEMKRSNNDYEVRNKYARTQSNWRDRTAPY